MMNWEALKFDEVTTGRIVRNKGNRKSFIVVEHRGDSVTAVRAVNITNPKEWEVLVETK